MTRRLTLFLLMFSSLALVACEEGEFTADPSNGNDTEQIVLELTTPEPLIAGDPFTVRATYTEDGNPVPGIDVLFTAVNASSESRPVVPDTVQTAIILGTADTTVYTDATDGFSEVVASAKSSSVQKNLSLQARQP